MTGILESERIYLRPITEADTPDILRWRNSPHVKEHFILRDPLTGEVHAEWLKNVVGRGLAQQYIIIVKESGRPIGSQYFHHIDREAATAEFGIFIGEKDELGRGYGTEVLKLAIRHAREDMKFKKITLRVLSGNEAALKIYTAQGFVNLPGEAEKKAYDGKEETIYHMELIL